MKIDKTCKTQTYNQILVDDLKIVEAFF